MSIQAAALLALATFIFVMTPGPGVFALISRSLQGGVVAGTTVFIGMLLADLLYLIAALAGLAFIARDFQVIFVGVQIIGGLYLVWLGVAAWRAPAIAMGQSHQGQRSTGRNLLAGWLTSISNPKVILFYMGLLPNFINLHDMTTGKFVSTILIVAFSLGFGAMIYVLLSARMRRFFSSSDSVRKLNRVSAAVLIGVGFYLVLGSLNLLPV